MARNGLDRSPLHLLHRVGQFAADAFAGEMSELTPRQLAVLLAVAGNDGGNQQELADTTGIDRSTMADIVRRLLRRGLLERRRTAEDKRAYAVTLTDVGRRLLRRAEPVAKRVDERLLKGLPADRREAFMAALASIVAAMTPAHSK
jgi:DNA-binding MarR family transcriptional regulator